MIAVLVAVPESHGGNSAADPPLPPCFWAAAAACSSPLLYLSKRTVRFLGELQIRSNCVSTSLIYLMSSLVLGDYLNLTVLMKADLNWLPSI